MRPSLVVLMAWVSVFSEAADFGIHTRLGHTIKWTNSGGVYWFTFQVKTCANAYVYLYNEYNGIYSYDYFGGWDNTKSAFASRGHTNAVYHEDDSFVSCNDYSHFWISWNPWRGVDIDIGRGSVLHPHHDVIKPFTMPTSLPVVLRYVVVKTHHPGYWMIPRSGSMTVPTTSTNHPSTEMETSTASTTVQTTHPSTQMETSTASTTRQTTHPSIQMETSTASTTRQTTHPSVGMKSSTTSTTGQATHPSTEMETSTASATRKTTHPSTEMDALSTSTTRKTASTVRDDNTTPQRNRTSVSTENEQNVTTGCRCDCKKAVKWNDESNATVTEGVLKKIKQELEQTLRVNKSSLSSARRRKISASDSRASSAGMGFVAGIILGAVPVLVVMADMPRIIRFVMTMKAAAGR